MNKNIVDLFCGCGGFSSGFENAGYNVVLGVDNWDTSLKTFRENHNGSKTLNLDLSEKDSINTITKQVKNQKIDLIIAGPPCQGFSLTGTRKENDSRNSLFKSVFELSKELKPKIIIIENVPGIVTLYDGRAKDSILKLAKENNYSCDFKVLFGPDYGLPQIRKRTFFVMIKDQKNNFIFPKELYHKDNYVSCSDAIGDLPSLTDNLGREESNYISNPNTDYQRKMRNGSKVLFNHTGTNHTDLVIDVISQVPEGGNHKDLPEGVGDSRKFNEAWTRYHSQKPSKTIDTGHRNHFHYKYNRVPTVRENARLQSFKDTFIFYGNKSDQYRQVGNAVPPLLAEVLAKELLNYF